jgi:hypothetical protein
MERWCAVVLLLVEAATYVLDPQLAAHAKKQTGVQPRDPSQVIVLLSRGIASESHAGPPRAARPFALLAGIDCVGQVWQHLEACGWAGSTNTGVPSETVLKTTVGRIITVDNAVIEGERIIGALEIAAKNVTIRNCLIISNFSDRGTGRALTGTGVITIRPGASAKVSHCTLDGSNATHAGIWHSGSSLTAIANNVLRVTDGIFSWSDRSSQTAGWNVTLEDNYFHDFTTAAANGHIDGYQTEGASHVVIRHNTFYITQPQTAAVSIWNSMRNSDDFVIDNNLVAGSGFIMYAQDYSPSEQDPRGGYSVTNVVHTNNRFSTVLYPCAGHFGVWYPRGAPTDGWHRAGNMILETGENVDSSNPHVSGKVCS